MHFFRHLLAIRLVLGVACMLLVASATAARDSSGASAEAEAGSSGASPSRGTEPEGSSANRAERSGDAPIDSWRARAERAAIAAAEAQVAPPDRLEILAVRFSGADPVAPAKSRLEPVEVSGPNESGVVGVTMRIVENGLPRGTARATVRVRVRGPALRAAKTLRAGKVIGPGDVERTDGDLTRLREAPLRRQADVLGLVPVRTLGSGRLITPRLLAPAPVVRRGETADLSIRNRGLVATIRARVLQDGAPGEIVPVENASSGTRLRARVLPDGSLLVER